MSKMRIGLAAFAAVSLSGCGAIMHGNRQSIDVQSTPSGVKIVTSPLSMDYTTPSSLNLERKNSYILTFTSPGYTPSTVAVNNSIGVGTVIMDVVFGGLLGVIVDAVTGDWYGLSPESVVVSLTKSVGAVGPDTIHVRLGKSANAGFTAAADAPNIQVQVRKR
jgi:hypothetical protein